MKCYNYKCDPNNKNRNFNSFNLNQGNSYNKNNKDLNATKETNVSFFNTTIVKSFLDLFRTNMESFVGSIAQMPLDIPILGESGSQMNRISGSSAGSSSSSGSGSGAGSGSSSGSEGSIQNKFNEFNRLLGEYTLQYKLMTNELIQNNSKESLQKYANSNIKFNNDYYFVNEFGFAHKYDTTDNPSQGTISSSCSMGSTPTTITSLEFNQLETTGKPMGLKQACGVAGFNVENSATGEKSFVDIEGVKHIYTGEVWADRHESCNIEVKQLTEEEYANIPKEADMTSNTFCSQLNVSPVILEDLFNLHKQLVELGDSVVNELNLVASNSSETNSTTESIRASITSKLAELTRSQQDIVRIGDEYKSTGSIGLVTDSSNTIKSRTRDSQIVVNMNYLKYMVGFLLVLFLIATTFYVFYYDISSPLLFLLLIILIIIVLSNFINFMYKKLYHLFLNKIV